MPSIELSSNEPHPETPESQPKMRAMVKQDAEELCVVVKIEETSVSRPDTATHPVEVTVRAWLVCSGLFFGSDPPLSVHRMRMLLRGHLPPAQRPNSQYRYRLRPYLFLYVWQICELIGGS